MARRGGARARVAALLACAAAALLAPAAAFEPPSDDWQRLMGAPVSPQEAAQLREEVREMFTFTYDNYMRHAFPRDELRPISCAGHDTLGGYALTLVDALDSIALMGNHSEFERAVRWVSANLSFDIDAVVSVFETNIRVMGGLLSAHLLANDPLTGHAVEGYDGGLLRLALDLGRRLLPAFSTPTGIPFGAVNLRRGVAPNESRISSTAGGGTLALEFGLLSALSGDGRFEAAARRAVRGLWARRSRLGLLGGHIDIRSGAWTHRDAGIGTSIDSFYEYLFKAATLLGDAEYSHMFEQAYSAVEAHLFRDPWYVEVNMDSAVVVWPLFNSLQAFWPGLQALAGRVPSGRRTHAAFMSVWRRVGFTPEGYNLAAQAVQPGQGSYPLRPELAESTYHLHAATGDPAYLVAGRDMVLSLRRARAACGYAAVADVQTGQLADAMESFFLAETVKYLYLLFDAGAAAADVAAEADGAPPAPPPWGADGGAARNGSEVGTTGGAGAQPQPQPQQQARLPRGHNFVDRGAYAYVFNTEGHMLPLRPEWHQLAQQPPPWAKAATAAAARGAGIEVVTEAEAEAEAEATQPGDQPGEKAAPAAAPPSVFATALAAASAALRGALSSGSASGGGAAAAATATSSPPPAVSTEQLQAQLAQRRRDAGLVADTAALMGTCPASAAAAAAVADSMLPLATAAAKDALPGGDGDDAEAHAAALRFAPPPGVSPVVSAAYTDYGPSSPAVRALAAEVASAQQGIVAAQLLAHVAASGTVVHAMRLMVHDAGDGTQRVVLFVNDGPPVWASAPGLSPSGLLQLAEPAEPAARGGGMCPVDAGGAAVGQGEAAAEEEGAAEAPVDAGGAAVGQGEAAAEEGGAAEAADEETVAEKPTEGAEAPLRT